MAVRDLRLPLHCVYCIYCSIRTYVYSARGLTSLGSSHTSISACRPSRGGIKILHSMRMLILSFPVIQ